MPISFEMFVALRVVQFSVDAVKALMPVKSPVVPLIIRRVALFVRICKLWALTLPKYDVEFKSWYRWNEEVPDSILSGTPPPDDISS